MENSTKPENIQLIRQDIRTLQTEKKELTAELNRLKYNPTPHYHTQHTQVTNRLATVEETLTRKQAELEKLLNSLQGDLFS